MRPESGVDSFNPYDSTTEIFPGKTLPLFGRAENKWHLPISKWRFFHAENRDLVPADFSSVLFDDRTWPVMEVPTVWQQEGYGLAEDLSYDTERKNDKKASEQIRSFFSSLSGSETEDDVGVFRSVVSLPDTYSDRAVYFTCAGICGRFELYIDGEFVIESSAFVTSKRILLSPWISGTNVCITLLVYRQNHDSHGRLKKSGGFFGMSGIFRMPEIVAESLVEIRHVAIQTAIREEVDQPNNTPMHADTGNKVTAFLRVRVALRNHTDLSIPVELSPSIFSVPEEYDPYHLPEIFRQTTASEVVLPANSEQTVDLTIPLERVSLWTFAEPTRYDLLLTLTHHLDRVIAAKKIRFGIRRVEANSGRLYLNGIPVPLKAVRYFGFDPEKGLSVGRDRMRRDIELMKQAGLNTVICAYYPADPYFYDLCDEYGILVISQADPESMEDMLFSLGHHPAIVAWSLAGKEEDENRCFVLKQKLLSEDPGRPFYMASSRHKAVSDIAPFPGDSGILFGEWTDICLDKENLQKKFGEGVSIFAGINGRSARPDDLSPYRYVHKGDMETFHEKTDIPIAQGICSADRNPHPVYADIKKQCETIHFISPEENPADITMSNMHSLASTPALNLTWRILFGGRPIRKGQGEVPPIPPLGHRRIVLPFTLMQLREEIAKMPPEICQEVILDIGVTTSAPLPWAEKGFELAFYQQVLFAADTVLPNTPLPPKESELSPFVADEITSGHEISVATNPSRIFASDRLVRTLFSRRTGGLSGISVGSFQFLSGTLSPSFYRAATNTDRTDQSYVLAATIFSRETDWRTIQRDLQFHRFHYEMDGEDFVLISHYRSAAFIGEVLVQYRLTPGGTVAITLACTPKYEMPRYGFRVRIPWEFCRLIWYGRGPGESYPDRRESVRIGRYEEDVRDLFHMYARPQETGAHCDTRVLILSADGKTGLRITAEDNNPFSFTGTAFSPEEIDSRQHPEELKEKDTFELFLDLYQRGIDRTGKETSAPFKKKTYRGTIFFSPWNMSDPLELSDRESPSSSIDAILP